jgi:cytochrome c oxidase subunit II
VTDTAQKYRHLFDIYVPIAVAVWVVIFGVVAFALVRYRRRPGHLPKGKAERPRLEAAYALVLACTVVVLLVLTFNTEAKVDKLPRHPGLVVNVTAAQWNWRFDYPQYRITQLSTTQREGTLFLPAHTQVLFRIRSQDVIHSFWIPQMRLKKDAFPGATNEVSATWGKPGVTQSGECAEFCGIHHADMLFNVRVLTPQAFAAWVRARQGASA